MHRFMWDVHLQPLPGGGGGGRGGGGGGGGLPIAAVPFNTVPAPSTPWANPGTYTAKLTVNGKTYSQPIEVKQDPRVNTPALVMQQVYTMTKAMYTGAVDAQAASQQVQSVRDQIAALTPKATGATTQALAEFDTRAASAASPLGAARSSLGGLMNSLQAADVQPTAIQLTAINGALESFRQAMAAWTTMKTTDVAALNAKLKAAGLEAVVVK
jgi:hypothetical protein